MKHFLISLFLKAASLQRLGMILLRTALVIVLVWIGGLKFADYEADSIVPLIANSPLMSFVYAHPAPEYRHYANKEGEAIAVNHEWQTSNRTYIVSRILGCTIVLLGVLIALAGILPEAATLGSALLILMCFTTLSFLVTTPEAWVHGAGDSAHGFPFLSGVGRLVIKDAIMLGAAVTTMADSARSSLIRISLRNEASNPRRDEVLCHEGR
jgi:reactive chlorine resistance protein C